MNITFDIIKDEKTIPITFFTINAISQGNTPNTSVIYSNGQEFTCTLSYGEIWNKVKRHVYESTPRK